MKKYALIITLLASLLGAGRASAQQVAIKTNLLYDAAATINLGAEVRLAPRWTIDISGNYNGWNLHDNMKWKHWLLQPEGRYWLCSAFNGHFFGLHAMGGQFNIGNVNLPLKIFGSDFHKLANYRYQGWLTGVGIAYGYSFILGRHWNLELEAGLGYMYMRYDTFNCEKCGERVAHNARHNYFGPTKLAVGLVYVF